MFLTLGVAFFTLDEATVLSLEKLKGRKGNRALLLVVAAVVTIVCDRVVGVCACVSQETA